MSTGPELDRFHDAHLGKPCDVAALSIERLSNGQSRQLDLFRLEKQAELQTRRHLLTMAPRDLQFIRESILPSFPDTDDPFQEPE